MAAGPGERAVRGGAARALERWLPPTRQANEVGNYLQVNYRDETGNCHTCHLEMTAQLSVVAGRKPGSFTVTLCDRAGRCQTQSFRRVQSLLLYPAAAVRPVRPATSASAGPEAYCTTFVYDAWEARVQPGAGGSAVVTMTYDSGTGQRLG